MIKLFVFFISVLLIVIILLRVPQESTGLRSFAMKTDILGSPSSAERLLNFFTAFGILVYLAFAIQLNFLNR